MGREDSPGTPQPGGSMVFALLSLPPNIAKTPSHTVHAPI